MKDNLYNKPDGPARMLAVTMLLAWFLIFASFVGVGFWFLFHK